LPPSPCPPSSSSVADLLGMTIEAKGLHDDITILLVRVVPEGRSGYWSVDSPTSFSRPKELRSHAAYERSKAMRNLREGLRLATREKMCKPPSWHEEYEAAERSDDPSVKGGEMYSRLSQLALGDDGGSSSCGSSNCGSSFKEDSRGSSYSDDLQRQ